MLFQAGSLLLIIIIIFISGCIIPVQTTKTIEDKEHLTTEIHLTHLATEKNSSHVTVTYNMTIIVENIGHTNTTPTIGYFHIDPPNHTHVISEVQAYRFKIDPIAPGLSNSINMIINVTLTQEQYSRMLHGEEYDMWVNVPGFITRDISSTSVPTLRTPGISITNNT